jgi:excisionase family DNA binding protein
MQSISFNDLPQAVQQLHTKLAGIEQLLKTMGSKKNDASDWLNIQQLCDYLPDKPAKATIYNWVQAGKIPYHKGSKRLRFSKPEIDQWLNGNTFNTAEKIAAEARGYVLNTKKGRADNE